MRVTNETNLLHGVTVTSREPPTPEMVVLVRGTFGLSEAGAIVPLDGVPQLVQGFLDADTFADGDDSMSGQLLRASDFADFKPRGEVLIYGSCHLPKPMAECDVVVSVGSWVKKLHVSGDRRWDESGEATPPAKFDTMPLDFTRAFGGPGHPTNPVGRGFVADGRTRILPNVELEKDRVTKPSSAPRPGGFGPVNPFWPERANKRGTKYDMGYVKKRAPYYAEDFDWTFFMASPRDQWFSGYFKGDEELTAENLFEGRPSLRTRLPGLRIRCFVLDDRDVFREVSMHLDSVALDADTGRISLSWRGLDAVRERDLIDVAHVLIAQEKIVDAPLSLDHYRREILAIKADPIGIKKAIAEAKAHDLGDDVDPLTKRLIDAELPVPAELSEQMREVWKHLESTPEVDHDKVLADIDAARKDPPPDPPPALPAFAGGKARLFLRPQWETAKAQVATLRARVPEGHEPPEGMRELEAKLEDPRLRELDPTVREATLEEPGPKADLSGQDLSARDFRGADLSGARLDGCVCIGTSFEGADLSGASFVGAMLFKANFTAANLSRANLTECNAAYATFDDAILSMTRLDDGYFANASLRGANLDEAQGNIVSFIEANLENVRANGLRLSQSSFEKAVLSGASFANAHLSECRFHNSRGTGSRFDGAELTDAVFNEATLSAVSFVGATLERSIWLGTDLSNANLSGVTAHDARFTNAALTGARFVGADLRGGNFYRASLVRVDFTRSNLFGADLTKAQLDHTLFVEANLYDSKLIEARGPGCEFRGANLKRAIYESGA